MFVSGVPTDGRGRVNIAQLRAFVAVVEHGSFSAAARMLGVSQPAVTMQVQALESDVGATLLDRKYRGVELTEAGKTLLPHARAVIDELEEARDQLGNLGGKPTGRLVVAASTTPGQYVLPNLLGEFLKRNPEVGVSIAVHDTAEVVEVVESGGAQIGMVGAKVRGARASLEELGTDELVMIASPRQPAAGPAGPAPVRPRERGVHHEGAGLGHPPGRRVAHEGRGVRPQRTARRDRARNE